MTLKFSLFLTLCIVCISTTACYDTANKSMDYITESCSDCDAVNNTELPEDTPQGQPCVMEGHLDISQNWYGYLGVFLLKPHVGRLYYHFRYPRRNCCVKVLLYLEDQVKALRKYMNCAQKQNVVDPTSKQTITLSPKHPHSGCGDVRHTGANRLITCTSGRLLKSTVSRRWSIAASSCGAPNGLELYYQLKVYGYQGHCPIRRHPQMLVTNGAKQLVRLENISLLTFLVVCSILKWK